MTREIVLGAGLAWALSRAGAVWLERGRRISARAFWIAFGGGAAARLLGLVGLFFYGLKAKGVAQAPLLLAYAFGVIFFLFLEMSRFRIKG